MPNKAFVQLQIKQDLRERGHKKFLSIYTNLGQYRLFHIFHTRSHAKE
jgi:hypothetical protein